MKHIEKKVTIAFTRAEVEALLVVLAEANFTVLSHQSPCYSRHSEALTTLIAKTLEADKAGDLRWR